VVPQVFEQMELDGVEPDMVTCCSLLKALERGGEWALAEQLFCQVRRRSSSTQGVLTHLAHERGNDSAGNAMISAGRGSDFPGTISCSRRLDVAVRSSVALSGLNFCT